MYIKAGATAQAMEALEVLYQQYSDSDSDSESSDSE